MKKPKYPRNLKNPIKRRLGAEARVTEAFANVPRITNDTVAEHREEVLAGARKFIYPLQHSKHRVVRTSAVLLTAAIIAFFSYVGLSLYKFQSTSTFIYDVTRVLPLPIAKAGPRWVSYESYLFELKRNMHYYHTQQNVDFDTPNGKPQLQRLKTQAMASVIQTAYVKQLAEPKGIRVSDRELQDRVAIVRSQNRLGSNDRVFKNVLDHYWGWTVSDFERELRQQLLSQKVVLDLDSTSSDRATSVLKQLEGGADFATVATANTDDVNTKTTGGVYPDAIKRSDHNVPPLLAATLFNLKAGQVSGIVNTSFSREIIKVVDSDGTTVHAAHIQFTLKDIGTFVKPLAAKQPTHEYIKF